MKLCVQCQKGHVRETRHARDAHATADFPHRVTTEVLHERVAARCRWLCIFATCDVSTQHTIAEAQTLQAYQGQPQLSPPSHSCHTYMIVSQPNYMRPQSIRTAVLLAATLPMSQPTKHAHPATYCTNSGCDPNCLLVHYAPQIMTP